MEIPAERINKMLGPDAGEVEDIQYRRSWYTKTPGIKKPIPKWNGNNPAKMLQPWLKSLREWRHITAEPVDMHGYLLNDSFEVGGTLYQCSARVPEAETFTVRRWELILREILREFAPYIYIELELMMEEFLYNSTRTKNENFHSYMTRRTTKKRDLDQAFGSEEIKCDHCSKSQKRQVTIPTVMWTYMIKRDAGLTDDNRKQIHQWDSGQPVSYTHLTLPTKRIV